MDLTNLPLQPVTTNVTVRVTLEPVSKITGIKALRDAFPQAWETPLGGPLNDNGGLNLVVTKLLFERLQAAGYTIVRATETH